LDETLARFEVVCGPETGRVIELCAGEYLCGRDANCDVVLQDSEEYLSGTHFRIKVGNGSVGLVDCKSTNGTFVNKTPVKPDQKHTLNPGDQIKAGLITLTLSRAKNIVAAMDAPVRVPAEKTKV